MSRLLLTVSATAAFVILLTGSSKPTASVYLAYGRMEAHAKQVCAQALRKPAPQGFEASAAPCAGDPSGGLAIFKAQLLAQFAATKDCEGVTFAAKTGNGIPELEVYFIPGNTDKHRWRLLIPTGSNKDFTEMQGPADEELPELARQVCSILLQHGARVPL